MFLSAWAQSDRLRCPASCRRIREALRLTLDYFSLHHEEFLRRWLPASEKERLRQTTPESWRAIVESLNNPTQQRIVTVDRARVRKDPEGGAWQQLDPVGQGRVQIITAGRDPMTQAIAVLTELQRLAKLDQNWDWAKTAVIAREWQFLEPVRAYCELHDIPAQMADEEPPQFWRLRETQALAAWLNTHTI